MLLQPLVDALDTVSAGPDWHHQAVLVRVVTTGKPEDELELGLLELDDHPAAYLEGFRAPSSWFALGLVCEGRAFHIDDRSGAGRARSILVADRTGALAGRTRFDDGRVIDAPATDGLLPELLRAALS